MLVGHTHMSAYTVVQRNHQIQYPEIGVFDEILDNCDPN